MTRPDFGTLRYGSVCSGIEAATVAWHPLGWTPAWFSEIEPFPCAVLSHHYPNVQNLGDMTGFKDWPNESIDLLVGGTPCQSFSVAGLRKGLDDPRGNLMLTYLAIADKYRPRWLVWENVPGVLSSNGGRDFGAFLGGLAELRYGFAYRILDAQYYGVAQRRRRVFVVGYFGDWRPAAAVLFERHSLSGHPAPRREAREVAPTIPSRSTGGGGLGTDFDCDGGWIPQPHADLSPALKARDGKGPSSDGDGDGAILVPMVSHSLRGDGFDASEDGTGRGTPLVPVAFPANLSGTQHASTENLAPAMGAKNPTAVAIRTANTSANGQAVQTAMQVRRLTPGECETLMGFPRGCTAIPWRGKPASECPDGPRYKALGNSMAVPCMRWIGERIGLVDAIGKRELFTLEVA